MDHTPTRSQNHAKRRPSAKRPSLDVQREASMADEGGVSAALLEIKDPKERKLRHPGARKQPMSALSWIAGAFGLVAVVGIGWIGIRALAASR